MFAVVILLVAVAAICAAVAEDGWRAEEDRIRASQPRDWL